MWMPIPTLDDVVPTDVKRGYDVRGVITRIVDFGDFLEVQPGYAGNIVVGFARITGRSVGIIANQPRCWRVSLNIGRPRIRPARFIRLLQCVHNPLVTAGGCTRISAGTQQEYGRDHPPRRERCLFRVSRPDRCRRSRSFLPQVLRRRGISRDVRQGTRRGWWLAWPTAEIAVMGRGGRGRHRLPQGA